MKNNKVLAWFAVLVVIIIIVVAWNAHTPSNNTNTTTTTTNTTTTKTGDTPSHPVTLQNSNGTKTVVLPLDGQTFRYASYDNTTIPPGENYLISFSGGVLSGGICANFSGSYAADNGALTSKLATSPKGCTLPTDVNAADQLFHTVLSQVSSYTLINNVLTIIGSGHTLVFNTFTK